MEHFVVDITHWQVYNQKMKHLQYEQQHVLSLIKIDNEQALKLQEEQAMIREAELV
jgi:1,2-phenylacetyl-CoA epoxidase PaaB subunit